MLAKLAVQSRAKMNLKNQPITFHPSRRPVGSLNAVIQRTIFVAGSPEPGFTPSALHRVGRGKARGRVQPGSIVQKTAAEIDQGIAAAARDDVDHPADGDSGGEWLRSPSPANDPGDFAVDCRTAAEATACTSMRRPMVMRLVVTDGRTAPRCRGNETVRTQERCSEAGSYANSRQPGTELTGAAENRYHPPQVQGPSGNSRLY
jgi:hypothetical protein